MIVVSLIENLTIQLLIGGCLLVFAALAGAVGIGGGALFTPLLFIAGGFTISQAIPIASATIFGVSLASTLVNLQKHSINYRLAMTLEPFTILGTIIGVQIFLNIPEYLILFFFVVLMVILSLKTTLRAKKLKYEFNVQNNNPATMSNSQLSPKKTTLAIGGSVFAGIISSILGIGGGLIKVPMLTELGLPTRNACGTGSLMVLFTSLSTTIQFIIFNQLNLHLGAIFFSIGFIGSIIGTSTSRYNTNPYFLQLLLAFTIILSTIFIIGGSFLNLLNLM